MVLIKLVDNIVNINVSINALALQGYAVGSNLFGNDNHLVRSFMVNTSNQVTVYHFGSKWQHDIFVVRDCVWVLSFTSAQHESFLDEATLAL